jgi:hypothetical protein
VTESRPARLAALALVPLAAAVAGFWALAWIPSVFVGAAVLPSGHDAVYHAVRILEAVDAPWAVAQFDARIHAPGGSWVNWPWGFDALMALLLRLLRDLAGLEPLRALVFLPPAFVLVNAGLVVAIARELRLPPAAQWLVALCFALSPLTQNLHGLGMVDHHFLEHSAVLATLLAGLRFAAAPERAAPAAALGAVLGLANGVHNGLFILQLPVLAAVGLLWLRRMGPGPRAGAAFGLALVGATLAVALPSEPFRHGAVRFDLLSWFHLHAAALTALAVGLMARWPPGPRAAAAGGTLLLAATLPLLRQVLAGLGFVSTSIYRDLPMPEMRGPFTGLLDGSFDPGWTLAEYSGLVLLLPPALVAAVVAVLRAREPARVLALVFLALGGAMLLVQYRFHQFGSPALFLLPLLLLPRAWLAHRRAPLAAALAVALACAPSLPRLQELPPPGGSVDFALTRPLYAPLAEACRQRPGVVLADHNDGHYVRFLTGCGVLANNLVLGPESFASLREAARLFESAPQALAARAPWVRYVLARREDDIFAPAPDRNSALRRALLFADPPWPPGWTLLAELRLSADGPVVGRLFELAPACCAAVPPPG